MVKQIVRDIFFLGQPSKLATKQISRLGRICRTHCRRTGNGALVWLQI